MQPSGSDEAAVFVNGVRVYEVHPRAREVAFVEAGQGLR